MGAWEIIKDRDSFWQKEKYAREEPVKLLAEKEKIIRKETGVKGILLIVIKKCQKISRPQNAETHSSLNKKNEKHKKYKYPQSITLVLFMGSYLHPLIYSKVAKSEKRAQIGSVLRETLRSYQYIFLMLSDSPVQKKCDTSLPVCRDDCKGHQ